MVENSLNSTSKILKFRGEVKNNSVENRILWWNFLMMAPTPYHLYCFQLHQVKTSNICKSDVRKELFLKEIFQIFSWAEVCWKEDFLCFYSISEIIWQFFMPLGSNLIEFSFKGKVKLHKYEKTQKISQDKIFQKDIENIIIFKIIYKCLYKRFR